jgi:NTP pyrophosphatase (non-canonical NTP hydrolase)
MSEDNEVKRNVDCGEEASVATYVGSGAFSPTSEAIPAVTHKLPDATAFPQTEAVTADPWPAEEKPSAVQIATSYVAEMRAGAGLAAWPVMDLQSGITALVEVCYGQAKLGGWWSDLETGEPKDRNDGEMFMLMVSEIGEALQGHRKNKMDDHLPHRRSVEVELADLMIRCAEYAGGRELDLAGAIVEKLAYNVQRADHKIESRLLDNGKKY